MKKIMMLFLVLMFIFSTKDVFAQDQYNLVIEKPTGIYFTRKINNSRDEYSQQFFVYIIGGKYAYCIEPGVLITTRNYTEGDFKDLGFSDEKIERLELIGHYGRSFPDHDNVRYSMAAQALIWELTGVDEILFWGQDGYEIDITEERKEILNLVNNHKLLPNFKEEYKGYLKQEIRLKDSNGVLEQYDADGSAGPTYIENNTLIIEPTKIGFNEVELKRKMYQDYDSVLFVGKDEGGSQKVARLNYNKEIKMQITLEIEGVHLLVQKKDENNNPIEISNIKFKVRDITRGVDICSGREDCTFRTSTVGDFITLPLDYGEYEIEEVEDQIVPGYAWNNKKIRVVINEDTELLFADDYHNYINVDFTNHSVSGSLEINKVGEKVEYNDNNLTYKETKLSNIEFELYKDDELINTLITDNDGKAKLDNLALGKYYLKEKTKLDNYQENDKIDFEIKQDNQYQTNFKVDLKIKNVLKKGTLEFTKEDLVTGDGIPNTIIEIYDEDDNLLFTRETNENGKVIINELPLGKYYIIEKEANSLYMITNEKVYFEIKENDEIVKAKMSNEKIEVEVPKTNTKESIVAHSLFGICFLIGIGRMYYEKKSY